MKKALAFALVLSLIVALAPFAFAGIEPYPTEYDPELFTRNVAISRDNAAEGMVLMENDGILPLAPGTNVAVFGICSKNTVKGGTGSGDVNTVAAEVKTISQGLQDAGLILDPTILAYYNGLTGTSQADVLIPATVDVNAAGQRNDIAIYVIGRTSAENADHQPDTGTTAYNLVANEKANLDRVFAAFSKVIVVLNVGSVMDTNWMATYPANALLFAGQGGHAGGSAVGDIITGVKNPSGKFVDTWAYNLNDYPARNNFSGTTSGTSSYGHTSNAFYHGSVSSNGLSAIWTAYPAVAYTEDIYVGYRYFETFDVPVKYEFGYGLSYTTFAVTGQSAKVVGDELIAQATVTNTGSVPGKEVVQVYMSAPDGTLNKPSKELKGYAKTDMLDPGMSQTVTIKTPVYWLTSYSEAKEAWILDAGKYDFYVGTSVKQVKLAGSWTLDALRIVEQVENKLPFINGREKSANFPVLDKYDDAATRAAKLERFVFPVAINPATLTIPGTTTSYLPRFGGETWIYTSIDQIPSGWVNYTRVASDHARNADDWNVRHINSVTGPRTLLDVYRGNITWEQYLSQFSYNDLTNLFSGAYQSQGADPMLPGAAWFTVKNDTFGIPTTAFPDGPAGLRITLNANSGGVRATQKATMFPMGTLNAQTWNTELVYDAGMAVGSELVHFGGQWWLAPGMNIHRDPLNGRNFEYYSEDPFLSGSIASAMSSGVMSAGGVSVVLKHFFANNQENLRTSVDTMLTERCAREIYLRNFEYAIKEANPRGIMSSYNHVNGEHVNQRPSLLQGIVFDEWGYNGVIMIDNNAVGAGSMCLDAGVHWIMPQANDSGTPREYGRLWDLQDWIYDPANHDMIMKRGVEALTEIMRTRAFTDAHGLPTWYAPGGSMVTQTVTKSDVTTAQTAGISAPAVYAGHGNIAYTVSLKNIEIGTNMVYVDALFDTSLAYVGSEVMIPGGSIDEASFDPVTGAYSAKIYLLQQGELFKASDARPILKIIFDGSAADADFTGALTSVNVWEVAASDLSIEFSCNLDAESVLTLYAPYDINGDGKIDLEDISLIIYNYYGAIEGDSKWDAAKAYDVNGDLVVDIFDLMIIMTYIF